MVCSIPSETRDLDLYLVSLKTWILNGIEEWHQSVLLQNEQIQQTLQILDYKKWYFKTAKAAETCCVHENRPKGPPQ